MRLNQSPENLERKESKSSNSFFRNLCDRFQSEGMEPRDSRRMTSLPIVMILAASIFLTILFFTVSGRIFSRRNPLPDQSHAPFKPGIGMLVA